VKREKENTRGADAAATEARCCKCRQWFADFIVHGADFYCPACADKHGIPDTRLPIMPGRGK